MDPEKKYGRKSSVISCHKTTDVQQNISNCQSCLTLWNVNLIQKLNLTVISFVFPYELLVEPCFFNLSLIIYLFNKT